jgi:hypothetical protein
MANQMARYWMSSPDWMNTLKAKVLPKPPGRGARLKGLGIVVSIAIAAVAIFALTHTLKNVDYNEVMQVIRHTNASLIALAAMLVVISYVSLTLMTCWRFVRSGAPTFPIGLQLLRALPVTRLPTALARFR